MYFPYTAENTREVISVRWIGSAPLHISRMDGNP